MEEKYGPYYYYGGKDLLVVLLLNSFGSVWMACHATRPGHNKETEMHINDNFNTVDDIKNLILSTVALLGPNFCDLAV